jgi:hypothetical protein
MTSQKRCGGDRSSALLEFVELLGLIELKTKSPSAEKADGLFCCSLLLNSTNSIDSSNPTNVFLKLSLNASSLHCVP